MVVLVISTLPMVMKLSRLYMETVFLDYDPSGGASIPRIDLTNGLIYNIRVVLRVLVHIYVYYPSVQSISISRDGPS